MLDICVKKHAWKSWIGIEYEGSKLSEPDGIKATKALLEKVRGEMS
jgi:L-ribulose-5-phosphate 3-epimerase